MVTEQTIKAAEATAEELRRRGAVDQAEAIEEIIAAVRDTAGGSAIPPVEELPNIVGATGPTIREWVRQGRYAGYRAGPTFVRKEALEDYVRRAGPSLDLEVISDDEAAALVANEREQA